MRTVTSAVITGLLIVGCAETGRVDVDRETEHLLETDRRFAAASLEHGAAEAFNMYLHDEATMFSAGSFPVEGREAIYRTMKATGAGSVLQWAPRAGEVAASGELGWTWGEYVAVTTGEGGEERSYGNYVNVWKKDAQGRWKVIADIGNDSPAPDENPDE